MQLKPDRKIFFVNVGEERDAARAMKIKMIPTQIVYDPKGHERSIFRITHVNA